MRLSNFRVPAAIAGLALLASMSVAPTFARPDPGDDVVLRRAVVKCWKPGVDDALTLLIEGVRKSGLAVYLTTSYGCTQWQLVKTLNVPPATGGCDPEQARNMGFKPERGDCNGGYWPSPRW